MLDTWLKADEAGGGEPLDPAALSRRVLQAMHAERAGREWTASLLPVQLGMAGDPWRVLVACTLLNKVRIATARPAIKVLADRSPVDVAEADPVWLIGMLFPLGLAVRRASTLISLARTFPSRSWATAAELPGVGPYALDALRIFCLGDLRGRPTDRILSAFLRAVAG